MKIGVMFWDLQSHKTQSQGLMFSSLSITTLSKRLFYVDDLIKKGLVKI